MVETVAKIREYATKIGYRPQRFAQIMRGGRTRVIGVVLRVGKYSSHHELVKRLANALNRTGYRLVMVDLDWFDLNLEMVRDYVLDQGVEGLIFCNMVSRTQCRELKSLLPERLPIISLSSSLEGVPNLGVDTQGAYHQLTRYHLALGSRRLVMLSMFRDPGVIVRPDWSTWDRVSGFVRGIQEAGGILVATDAVRELLEIPNCKTSVPEGYEGIVGEVLYPEKEARLKDAFGNGFYQTLALAERGEMPESLICLNDDTALGALAACADRGWQVPSDLRVSGYDDTAAGLYGMVPLTTVRKPLDDLASTAVKMLIALVEEPDTQGDDVNMYLSGQIVVRRSTGSVEENSRLEAEGFFASDEVFEFRLEQQRQDAVAVS